MWSLIELFLKPYSLLWNEPSTIFFVEFSQWELFGFFILLTERLCFEFSSPSSLPGDLCLKLLTSLITVVKYIKLLRDETKENCNPPSVSTVGIGYTKAQCRLDEKQHQSGALLSSSQLGTFRTSLETRVSKNCLWVPCHSKGEALGLLAEDTRKMAQAKPHFVPSC